MCRPGYRLAAASLALLAAAAVAADKLPARKPGQWETTTENSLMAGQKMVMQQCIDKDSDANLMARAEEAGSECTPPKIMHSGNQVVIESTCKIEGSTATTRGVFKGDYDRAYSGEVVTKFSPPLRGMGENRMTMQARWLGPCAAGERPGAMRMKVPGLGEIDLEQMMKNMPRMPGQ